MSVTVTIHQPSYLPWIPFLEKGLLSDVYVLLDNVQFEKNSEQNRNRVKTSQGETWLSVPVSRKSDSLLNDIGIAPAQANWNRKHKRTIEESYRKAPHFSVVMPRVRDVLDAEWSHLLDLNVRLDKLFLEMAGFSGRIILASELPIRSTGSDRILRICQQLEATEYLSGTGGRDYLKLADFVDANIGVRFQSYEHREYPQLFPKLGFLPRLSALDLFMNVGVGQAARDVILSGSRWET